MKWTLKWWFKKRPVRITPNLNVSSAESGWCGNGEVHKVRMGVCGLCSKAVLKEAMVPERRRDVG